MDLDELRALVAVVETSSMTRAARALGFARSTLNRRIDELEQRVGVSLLERTHSGVTPTPAGQLLALDGARVLQDASSLLERARQRGSDSAGMLHLMLAVGLPPEATAMSLGLLMKAHPTLTFDLHFSESPLSEVLEGIDAVCYLGSAEDSPGSAWVRQTLLPAPQRLLASPGYLASRGTPTTIDDLLDHDLLLWQRPGPPTRRLDIGGITVERAPTVVSPDIHGLVSMALMGMGIACVPEGGGVVMTQAGQLVPVLPTIDGPHFQFFMATPRALVDLPRVNALTVAAGQVARTFIGE